MADAVAQSEALLDAARDKTGSCLNLHEVVVSTPSESRTIVFRESGVRVDLRSVSKPVLALLCGALFAQEPARRRGLDPASLVWPFFEGEVRLTETANLPYLRRLRVSHLLNSTLGHQEGIMFRKDIGDRPEETLLDYAFNAPLDHAPGTHFVYSNAGAFLLSALLTRVFDRPADELASSFIFDPLGISEVEWRRFGQDCAGCPGLSLSATELNRIGRGILDVGAAAAALAPLGWRAAMLTSHFPTPTMTDEARALPKRGYGDFLWKSREGHCYTDGTDGQYLVLCGDRETVLTVTGEQPDMKPIGEALRPILDFARQR